jgi:hypothetical protein
MDRKEKVEYHKQVRNANNSVINALKPYIAAKGLPDVKIFEALILSTARTVGINKEDMFSVKEYCEELIREIISDVYVSNDKKQEYTNSLSEYKTNIVEMETYLKIKENDKQLQSYNVYGEKIRRQESMYFAIMVDDIAKRRQNLDQQLSCKRCCQHTKPCSKVKPAFIQGFSVPWHYSIPVCEY